MAITLRTVTGSALTFEQLDTNFSSFFYSASYSSGTVTLFSTGSAESGSSVPTPASMSFYIPVVSNWTASVDVSSIRDQVQISGSLINGSGSISAPNSSFSHGEGFSTTATGMYSHAEGSSTQATATGSHAEGSSTIASGTYSHAEGTGTIALGAHSHAEGRDTLASGSRSHAEGQGTIASGSYSHAEGLGTIAIGSYSHAEGYSTITSGQYQHVQGQYNISSPAQSAFIIGNGTSDVSRSNLVFASGSTFQVTGSIHIKGAPSYIYMNDASGSSYKLSISKGGTLTVEALP